MRIPEQFGSLTGLAYLFVIQNYGGNKAKFDDYVDDITAAIPEQINILSLKKAIISLIPQALKPSVEVAANVRTYPDVLPIVSDFMKNESPKEQYTAYTSNFAKWLGATFNASPALIDYWIKNQLGPVGAAGITQKLPTNPIAVQEQDYVMSGRSYNDFYDRKNLVENQYDEIIKKNPTKYPLKDKFEIKNTNEVYNDTAKILKAMRDLGKKGDIPVPERLGFDLVGTDARDHISRRNIVLGDVISGHAPRLSEEDRRGCDHTAANLKARQA